MPFVLLLLLALTCLPVAWPEPPEWLGALGSTLATWVGVGLLGLVAAVLTWRLGRRMQLDRLDRGRLVRRFNLFRRYYALALIGYYLAALCFLGWGHTSQACWPGQPQHVPGVQLLLLAPFLTGLLTCWSCAYHIEKTAYDDLLNEPFPSFWAYLGLQIRHNLLLVVPPLVLLLFEQGLFYAFPELQESSVLLPFLVIGLLSVAFVSIPLLLRAFLGLRSLPPCPQRERLEACARRIGFRFSDILIWDTRQTVANAMVTGILPWLRYVVITDRLLHDLSEDELEAVFGHEVGHVKHHHMAFYILFLMGSVLVFGALSHMTVAFLRGVGSALLGESAPALASLLESNEVLVMLPMLGLLAAYIFVVFGFISRRCERQADAYGARVASCPAFIAALEKVAIINGISRERPGWFSCWQHGTIAERVAFLERMDRNPQVETNFQKRLGLLKWSMALGLAAFLSLSAAFLGPARLWEILKHL